MKRTVIICITIVCAALLLAATATAKDDKNLEHQATYTKEIVVPGNRAWVNTGIKLNPGDTVTIAASGTVWFNPDSSSNVSPQGYLQKHYQADYIGMDFGYCGDPYEQFNHAALIGEVNGDVFYVGPKKVVAKKVGILSLGINDCSTKGPAAYANSGQFTVVVTVHVNKKLLKP